MAFASLLRRTRPFVAILLVATGWALSHQVGSDAVFDDCTRSGNGLVVIVSGLGLLIAAGGGVYGLRAGGPLISGRGFLGAVAALLSLLAVFAILLQVLAGLILPPCAA